MDDVTGLLQETLGTADAPPPTVLAAARAAYSWRTLEAELARVVHDSLLDDDAAVRGPGDARVLSFAAGACTLDVEVTPAGEQRSVVGQLTPPRATLLQVHGGEGRTTDVETDDLGRFAVDGDLSGPVAFTVDDGTGRVKTEWVLL